MNLQHQINKRIHVLLKQTDNNAEIARIIIKEYNLSSNPDSLRKHVSNIRRSKEKPERTFSYEEEKDFVEVMSKGFKEEKPSKKEFDPTATTLLVGDLHEPFSHNDYLRFCKTVEKNFECTQVIFMGDVIDNHYSSFHPTDPDGLGGKDELNYAIKKLKAWHSAFPNATVLEGNHDRIVKRKLFDAGISSKWFKEYTEVLETPTWKFVDKIETKDILFTHGTGIGSMTGLYNKALHSRKSVVIGHIHSEAMIRYVDSKVFTMIVGCGIDNDAYAFEYNKAFPKPPIVSCGVLINGNKPIILTL